jgi:hypothetical protein
MEHGCSTANAVLVIDGDDITFIQPFAASEWKGGGMGEWGFYHLTPNPSPRGEGSSGALANLTPALS